MPVKGTPFDFNKPTPIATRIGADDEQIKFGGGYDHNFVIAKGAGLGLMARVTERPPAACWKCSRRSRRCSSTAATSSMATSPAKAAGFTNIATAFAWSRSISRFAEQPKFPSVVLRPGKTYKNTIIYRFLVAK